MPLFRSFTLTRKSHRSIEDAVGNAFLQLLAETNGQGQDQRFVLQSPFFAGPRARPCTNNMDANKQQ